MKFAWVILLSLLGGIGSSVEASFCSRIGEILGLSYKSTYYQTLYQELTAGAKIPDEAMRDEVVAVVKKYEGARKKKPRAEAGFAYLILFKFFQGDEYIIKLLEFRNDKVDLDLSIAIDRAFASEIEKKSPLNRWR